MELLVRGPVNPETGWLVDFAELRRAFAPLREQLDHHCLNDIPGLENPTSEHLARWIWVHLKDRLPQLAQITIHESDTSRCIYRG